MTNQTPLFPDLKEDTPYKPMTEAEAKTQTADLLQTLLEQGFVNVESEDISDEHLKKLITTLRD